MSVKPATGEVLEETKRTRVLPAEPQGGPAADRPDIWELVETLKPVANLEKPDYEFTIYRGRKAQTASEKEWLGKFYEPMRREVIQQKFGGGEYNVWLKMGPGLQLRYNVDVKIGGQPINPVERNPMPMPSDATGQLVFMLREEMRALREEVKQSRGGDLGLEAVKQALALNGTVFNSAAAAATGTLQRLGEGGHAPNPMSDPMAMITFLVQVKSLFAPGPTNSLQETLATLKLFKESGLMGGGGGGEKLTDRLVMGLMNQLPTLATHFSGMMGEYRKAEEAKLRSVALQRGQTITVQPVQQPAPPPPAAPSPNVITMPTPAQEPAQPEEPTEEQKAQMENLFQTIETRIALLMANPQLTPEQAAIESLTFIDQVDPAESHPDKKNLIDALLQYGQIGVDHLFNSRPILMAVPKGDRLEAFKKAFLENGRRVPVPEDMKPTNTLPA